MTDDDRAPAARLHRRAGRRRAGQRRARDRGHDPQHRPAAPGHPRHAAHRRPPRRRAGRLGRAGHGLHAPRLREADRGPHVPADHHAGQPHRLAGQLRQRGAVHPRRREADGGRGAARGPSGSARCCSSWPRIANIVAVPRRHGRAARRRHAGLLRLPRPRVRPQPDRGASPAGGSTRTSTASAASRTTCPRAGSTRPSRSWSKVRDFCDEMEDAAHRQRDLPGPHPRHRRDPRRRRARLRPVGRQPPRQRRRLGPAPRRSRAGSPATRSTGRSGPTPTATRSPATGCACRRSARRPRSSTSCSTACPPGRSWPRCPASSRCPRARRGSRPRTRSARWATTSSPRATSGRSG